MDHSQWEHIEGKLLTYELILRFLLYQHKQYTFPSYTSIRCSPSTITPSRQATYYIPDSPIMNSPFKSTPTLKTKLFIQPEISYLERLMSTGTSNERICCTSLKQIFYNVLEAFSLPRWEIRRMVSQVLPLISEIMLWTNMDDLITISFFQKL